VSIHVEQDGECAVCIQQVTPGLRFARVSWPCDAAEAIARADKAEAELADLPKYITNWMMGRGMVVVHRWMSTGWRETMYDEGVAMWTAALAAHKEATE